MWTSLNRGRFMCVAPARTVTAGARYADDVRDKIAALAASKGVGPAAFIAEGILGCGGQVVPPHDYFRHAFRHVHNAGGVCIVDEVQTGFGRVGSKFWAFELQEGAQPDIVTMGKRTCAVVAVAVAVAVAVSVAVAVAVTVAV